MKRMIFSNFYTVTLLGKVAHLLLLSTGMILRVVRTEILPISFLIYYTVFFNRCFYLVPEFLKVSHEVWKTKEIPI